MTTNVTAKECQVSFRTTPENKRLARIEAAKRNLSLNNWVKEIVLAQLPKPTEKETA